MQQPSAPTPTPTEQDYENAYLPGEFLSVRGGYVLLENGPPVQIVSYHDGEGEQVENADDAEFACVEHEGLVFAYPLTLRNQTLH